MENSIPTPSNSLGDAYPEKRKMIAASRVPIPPNVTGINPMKIAIGTLAIANTKGTLIPNAAKKVIVCTIDMNQIKMEYEKIIENAFLSFVSNFVERIKF